MFLLLPARRGFGSLSISERTCLFSLLLVFIFLQFLPQHQLLREWMFVFLINFEGPMGLFLLHDVRVDAFDLFLDVHYLFHLVNNIHISRLFLEKPLPFPHL